MKHRFLTTWMISSSLLLMSLFLVTVCPIQVHGAEGSGSTSLTILPLDEDLPRIYQVSDIEFGKINQDDVKQGHLAKNDLTIEILEGRSQPSDWQLEMKLGGFTNQTGHKLTDVNYSLGVGQLADNVELEAKELKGVTFSSQQTPDTFAPLLVSKAQTEHGFITYIIPKELVQLTFGEHNATGKYHAVSYWQLVNADL